MAFQGQLAVFDFGDSDNNNALTTPDEVGFMDRCFKTFHHTDWFKRKTPNSFRCQRPRRF